MDILTDLLKLTQDGLYVTIVCMFLFYFIPIQKIKKEWLMEVVMRLIIILTAFGITWLSNETAMWNWVKADWKSALIALAFSSLFYEFAGKFIVRKWFDYYKEKKSTPKE